MNSDRAEKLENIALKIYNESVYGEFDKPIETIEADNTPVTPEISQTGELVTDNLIKSITAAREKLDILQTLASNGGKSGATAFAASMVLSSLENITAELEAAIFELNSATNANQAVYTELEVQSDEFIFSIPLN